MSKTKTFREMIEDIDTVEHAGEELLAWALSEHRYVRQTVYTLVVGYWKCPVDDKATLGILWIYEVVVLWETTNVSSWDLNTELA